MYPVSDSFHEAVRNGMPQKALLIFSDGMVFTNEDINVENGISFRDNFNMEENLAIGQATSNEISFSLFNDARLLNNYPFGDFTATLGVLIDTDTYGADGSIRVEVGENVYNAYYSQPYIRMNDVALAEQPNFSVCAMFAIGGKLYCFGATGNNRIVYNTADNSVDSRTSGHLHMIRKAQTYWAGVGMSYDEEERILKEWKTGKVSIYEFCPFGKFTAERPKAPDLIQIDMTCYDFMQKFEKDMPDANTLGISYPIDVNQLLSAMCNHVGVDLASNYFINSDATITEQPDDFKNATMRDVLKWIAEAAGSNARFNRDGVLELAWLNETGTVYTAMDYKEFNPCWYETRQITKLYNRDTLNGTDKTVGTGDEGYLIQDNPILRGVN